MDWMRAIERNREALAEVIATIAAMLEVVQGQMRISRGFQRSVLRLLGPAEAAVRRLIVIAARGLKVNPTPQRPAPLRPIARGPLRRLAFRLFDWRKHFGNGQRHSGPRLVPRILVFGNDPRVFASWSAPQPVAPPPAADGLADGRRLVLRFEAVQRAFSDLPRQAMRLARLRVRREAKPGFHPRSPLRPGPPPGGRRKKLLAIDFILDECHGLAFDALRQDSS